jgi:hypothetical protein
MAFEEVAGGGKARFSMVGEAVLSKLRGRSTHILANRLLQIWHLYGLSCVSDHVYEPSHVDQKLRKGGSTIGGLSYEIARDEQGGPTCAQSRWLGKVYNSS